MAFDPRLLLTWAGVLCVGGGVAVAVGAGGSDDEPVTPAAIVLHADDLAADLGLDVVGGDDVTGELGAGIEGGTGCPPFSIDHVFDEARGDVLSTVDLEAGQVPDEPFLVAYTAAGEAEPQSLEVFFADFDFPQASGCLAAELSIGPGALAEDGEVSLESGERDGVRQAIFRSVLPDGSAVTTAWLANDDGIIAFALLGSNARAIDDLDEAVLGELRRRLTT